MISVLVVDDSVAARRSITDALTGVPDVRVVASVPDGRTALAKLATGRVDVIVLDVHMPGMDGLATLLALRQTHPTLPVIMASTPDAAGAESALNCIAAGADDVVLKPAGASSVVDALRTLRASLVPRIFALCDPRPVSARRGGQVRPLRAPVRPGRSARTQPVEAIIVGSSTGATAALAALLAALPSSLRIPVLIAQHAPEPLGAVLVQRLGDRSELPVVVASDGAVLAPGTAYLAPTGWSLEVVRHPAAELVRLSRAPDDELVAGPLDALFTSASIAYGPSALAVVLPSVGEDGVAGVLRLGQVGAEVLAAGAPGSGERGPGAGVELVVPFEELAEHLIDRVGETARADEVALTPRMAPGQAVSGWR